jgi:peptide/nickel transport system substrate-binding protein
LLDSSGWKRGADGIREKNGVKLNLLFVGATGSPNVDNEIEFFRSTWKEIGVGIQVRRYPSQMLFAPMPDGGIIYGGKWDVVVFNWVADPLGDYSFLYACDQIPPNGQNDIRWCTPQTDAAMRALFGHYDQAQRNADDRIVFAQLAKDLPQITLYGVADIEVYNKDLKNFHPNNVTPFDDFMDVDI